MNINEIKKETANELKGKVEELDYITEDLILDYFQNAKDEDMVETDPEGKELLSRWGVYGNSITYSKDKVYYKRNDKGTSNYGCGTDSWSVGKNNAKYIIEKGRCSGGRKMYFIGNYRP